MQVKQINPMNVLSFEKRTTINEMVQYVRVIARQLYTFANQANLEITGPVYWIYYGMDGNPETEFTLKIALPVHQCKPVSGEFHCERLEAFTYVSELHIGAWDKLPHTYEKIIRGINTTKYAMSGICREIYIHMDFDNPQNSITDVQIGVQV